MDLTPPYTVDAVIILTVIPSRGPVVYGLSNPRDTGGGRIRCDAYCVLVHGDGALPQPDSPVAIADGRWITGGVFDAADIIARKRLR